MGLKDKIKQEVEQQAKSQIDWNIRKKEWLESVDLLGNLIKEWFGDYERESLVKFAYSEKKITEEYLGTYNTRVLHMNFANGKEIILEPAGTLIIGAWARYDLYLRGFNKGKYYILRYKDSNDAFSWHLVSKTPFREVHPLSKALLEKTFEEWLS